MPAHRAKRAAKNLIRQCRQGREDADSLSRSIRDYFNDRFGLTLASLTPEDAADILASKGVDSGTVQKLRTILIELENNIYTGQTRGVGRMSSEIPGLIREIEGEIR